MKQRGRKSSLQMAVVTPLTRVPRPLSPADDALTDDERREWTAIVDRLPADTFPRETHALLAAYCRHIVAGRHIAASIRELERALGREVDEGRPALEVICESAKMMNRLLAMQDREVRAASSLATRLRLTPQSQKLPQQPKPPRDHPAPWEHDPKAGS